MTSSTDNILSISDEKLKSGEFDTKNKEILKYIERNINTLSADAMTQICKIIKRNDERFTIKKDCVLINLGNLKAETIKEIVRFIVFIKNNQNILEHDEQLKSKIKQQYCPE